VPGFALSGKDDADRGGTDGRYSGRVTHSFTPDQLSALDQMEYRESDALALSSSLRKRGFTPEQTSDMLTQAKLRVQARSKFGEDAQRMLFTRSGLEQATRRAVSLWHARRFRDADAGPVADLGCGIGADSAAFLSEGLPVMSYDIDPDTASMARHNLSVHHESEVRVGDVTELDPASLRTQDGTAIRSLWLDPARRDTTDGQVSRLFDPEAFAPPFSVIRRWAETGMPMGVKMGPGMDRSEIPENAEAEWVSCGGDVVEVVLWFNALARPGVKRSATLLGADPLEPDVLAQYTSDSGFGQDAGEAPPVGPPADFLYEPDGAVIRAGLVDQLVSQVGGHLLDPRIAYFASDRCEDLAGATCWVVDEILPMGTKALRTWVRENGITGLTIKKRGVDVVPETLRRQLLAGSSTKKKKPAGNRHATLILTRWESPDSERRAAFVVRRAHP
jgi:hypothetical protein